MTRLSKTFNLLLINTIPKYLLSAIVLFLILTLSFSCANKFSIPSDVTEILEQAGDNKQELMEAINHYKRDNKDSLKLKALYFILRNVDGLVTLDTTTLYKNQIYFDNLYISWLKTGKNDFSTACIIIDSLNNSKHLTPFRTNTNYVDENKILTSKFLINNIDLAFYAWKTKPWAKRVSFEYFCEYILPYRCTNTYSADARSSFLKRYSIIPDSIKNTENPSRVAEYITHDIDQWFTENPNIVVKYPYLASISFSNLLKGKVGDCLAATSLKVTALRSLGIPAVIDEIPNWGNSNSSHFWWKVVDPTHKSKFPLINNRNIAQNTQDVISGSSYDILPVFNGVPKDVVIHYKRTVAKVYRRSFSKQRLHFNSSGPNEGNLPEYFSNDRLIDVTNEYVECTKVVIDTKNSKQMSTDEKNLFLCVFDNNNWRPIAKAKIKNHKAIFSAVGKNIVYLPAYFKDGSIIPAGNPIIITLNDQMLPIYSNGRKEKIVLYTKYPYRIFVHFWQTSMVGGKFQFANNADFSDSVTIYKIKKFPFYKNEVTVNDARKFRYLFFRFRDTLSQTIFSKLQFVSVDHKKNEEKLFGKLIGNQGVYPNTSENINNSDRNSYMISKKNGERFVGLDLGKGNEAKVTKIIFIPRDDDNGIVSGDDYELFYWNNDWISLGFTVGNSLNQVVFKKVPQGALLLLKNIRGGDRKQDFYL